MEQEPKVDFMREVGWVDDERFRPRSGVSAVVCMALAAIQRQYEAVEAEHFGARAE